MKILYIITKANWGGAQKYVFDLSTQAKGAGFEVVVAYGNPGKLGVSLEGAGIRTIELPQLGRDINIGADFSSFKTLFSIIKSEFPDIVHLNSSKAGGLGALAARLLFVKRIIFTAHGWAFNEDRPLWQKIPIALIHYLTVALSHITICNSEATKRDMGWMPFVQSKIRVVYNGIEEPEFKDRESARELLMPKINGFFVGMVCELHPTKGVFEAVEAFSLIEEKIPDAYLVILGEGHERLELEKEIARHTLGKRVKLLGHVTDAASYMKAFDVFLFPSRSESLGYALIEAGFASLPTVATHVGGIPEIIENGKTGILVPSKNPQAIAKALAQLEENPVNRRSLGESLREKVRTSFSKDRLVHETMIVYRS